MLSSVAPETARGALLSPAQAAQAAVTAASGPSLHPQGGDPDPGADRLDTDDDFDATLDAEDETHREETDALAAFFDAQFQSRRSLVALPTLLATATAQHTAHRAALAEHRRGASSQLASLRDQGAALAARVAAIDDEYAADIAAASDAHRRHGEAEAVPPDVVQLGHMVQTLADLDRGRALLTALATFLRAVEALKRGATGETAASQPGSAAGSAESPAAEPSSSAHASPSLRSSFGAHGAPGAPHPVLQSVAHAVAQYRAAVDQRCWVRDVVGEASELVVWMDRALGGVHGTLKRQLMSVMDGALETFKWPKTGLKELHAARAQPHREHFVTAFRLMCDLGHLDAAWRTDAGTSAPVSSALPRSASEGPLAVLRQLAVLPAIQFRYHFMGNKPTNRLDKPEWWCTHLTTLMRTTEPFFDRMVQPLLDENGFAQLDARNAWTDCLLETVARKLVETRDEVMRLYGAQTGADPYIRSQIERLLDNPQAPLPLTPLYTHCDGGPAPVDPSDTLTWKQAPTILLHTIHEVALFDAALREQNFFPIHQIDPLEVWPGVVAVLLDDPKLRAFWVLDQYHHELLKLRALFRSEKAFDLALEPDLDVDGRRLVTSTAVLAAAVSGFLHAMALLQHPQARQACMQQCVIRLLKSYLLTIRQCYHQQSHGFYPIGDESSRLPRKAERLGALGTWITTLFHVEQLIILEWSLHPVVVTLPDDPMAASPAPSPAADDANARVLDVPEPSAGVAATCAEVANAYAELRSVIAAELVDHLVHELTSELYSYASSPTWGRATGAPEDADGAAALDVSPAMATALAVFLSLLLSATDRLAPPPQATRLLLDVASRVEHWVIHDFVLRKQFTPMNLRQIRADWTRGFVQSVLGRFHPQPERLTRQLGDLMRLFALGTAEASDLKQALAAGPLTGSASAGPAKLIAAAGVQTMSPHLVLKVLSRRLDLEHHAAR
ncbi:hypothetical protein CXG81DRAFT_20398 [Caulochytrium protostelioides]|uniref:RAD50-interacting protein 1 n=1 Tax=Caulochytrium protostelioides TaxID=1555241 RepID=A0A4P9X3B2_9FUNG|nr:hypothetical protein CXG81DRAFT_20398 [Caulochytrium protostelioides]|eukprot:RKO99517.1 hypothetical protein CXG81DRAFT_20398 [Caulochytrium protostelioides]